MKKTILLSTHIVIVLLFLNITGIRLFGSDKAINDNPELILQKCLSNYESIPPLSMQTEFELYEKSGDSWVIQLKRNMFLNKDNNRVDVISKWYNYINGEIQPEMQSRAIWDGNNYIYRQFTENFDPSAFIAAISIKKSNILPTISSPSSDAFLNGILPYDEEHFATKLKNNSNLNISSEVGIVSDHQCYVITSKTDTGTYKLWIDPQNGFSLRKAVITKQMGDILWGKIISKEDPQVTITLDAIEIKEINGHYIPISGEYIENRKFANGEELNIKRQAKRTNIQFNPAFSETKAFVMDGIPDGTRVTHMDFPGIRYVWYNGRAIVDADVKIFEAISSEVNGLKKQIDPPTSKKNTENGKLSETSFEPNKPAMNSNSSIISTATQHKTNNQIWIIISGVVIVLVFVGIVVSVRNKNVKK